MLRALLDDTMHKCAYEVNLHHTGHEFDSHTGHLFFGFSRGFSRFARGFFCFREVFVFAHAGIDLFLRELSIPTFASDMFRT
jgi:hypothetical protein